MIRLIQGDCIEKMKDLSDNSIDLVITDLPYGLGNKRLSWDKPINLAEMWREIWRITKSNSPVFMFADMKYAVTLINSQPKYFKYEIVWNKNQTTTPMLSFKRFGKSTEYILVFYKKQPKYLVKNHHKVVRTKQDSCVGGLGTKKEGKRINKYYEPKLPINIVNCDAVRGHNKKIRCLTEKPVPLIEHILKYYAEEGDTCLDICSGSGSTGEACKNRNINFIGIEINQEHFKICEKRLILEN